MAYSGLSFGNKSFIQPIISIVPYDRIRSRFFPAQVQPSAADPMARIKAVERATELARRLYPDHFKKENP